MKKRKLAVIAALAAASGAVFLLGTACGKDALAIPSYTLNEDHLLSWKAVTGARGYTVEIKNADTGEYIPPAVAPSRTRTNCSLAFLEEGDYEIRIKATGNGKTTKDSDWTEVIEFHKEYETGCIYKLINSRSEYQIEKAGSASGVVMIEAEYRGKPVTQIADNAFRNNSRITEVVVGENVNYIGANAFYNCRNLVSVSIPDSVVTLGESVFQNCLGLETVNIPAGVEAIEAYAFGNCQSLKAIDLGENIVSIGESAFSGCAKLESLEVPDSVVSLGEDAFAKCTSIKSLSLGKGLEEIGKSAFFGDTAMENCHFAPGGSLRIIGEQSFAECSALTKLEFPDTLKEIGYRAFFEASALGEVVIPDSVTKIGATAFYSTKIFKDAYDNQEPYYYADKWLLSTTEQALDTVWTTPSVLDVSKIKSGIVGIADQAFYQWKELGAIDVPASVKYIGEFAFARCEVLYRVTMTNVEEIGYAAFSNNEKLVNVSLGTSLRTIGDSAFYGCTTLADLRGSNPVPATVTEIGTQAFAGTAIASKSLAQSDWDSERGGCGVLGGVLYVGRWAVGFSGVNGEVSLQSGTVGIARYAFYQCRGLTNMIGLQRVRYIGYGAFFECVNLTIAVVTSAERIEPFTFYHCSRLNTVTVGENLKYVGRSAFSSCVQLTAFSAEYSPLETIEDKAFYGCTNLKSVELGEDLKTLSPYAFYKCEALEAVTLPDSLNALGERAFYGCSALASVEFGSGLTEIEPYTFGRCAALKSVVLPSGVKSLGDKAFYGCTALESIDLGAVERIGEYAFYGAENVKALSFPSTVKSISKYAFKGMNEVQSVFVPVSIGEIAPHVFYGWKNVTIYTDATKLPAGWNARWNSSYRPVVLGCKAETENGADYVVSVTVQKDMILNDKTNDVIGNPTRKGYKFVGWSLSEDGAGEFATSDLKLQDEGTVLYAIWTVAGDEPEVPETPEETETSSNS